MWIISRDDPSLCDSCFLSSPPSSPIQPIQMRPNLNWSLSRKMKSRPPGNLYPKSHRKGSAKNKPTRYLRPRKHLTKYDKIHSSLQLALSLSLLPAWLLHSHFRYGGFILSTKLSCGSSLTLTSLPTVTEKMATRKKNRWQKRTGTVKHVMTLDCLHIF